MAGKYRLDWPTRMVIALRIGRGLVNLHDRCESSLAVPAIQNDWPKGNYKFVDEKLERYFDKDEMDRMIECALACVERYPQNRPEMSKVVEVLAGNIPRKNLKN